MITSAFILFIAFLISMVLGVFVWIGSLVGSIPYVSETITWIISPLQYFRGIFPIDDVLLALSFLINFFVAMFLLKLLFWLMSGIPFLKDFTNPIEENNYYYDNRKILLDEPRKRKLLK